MEETSTTDWRSSILTNAHPERSIWSIFTKSWGSGTGFAEKYQQPISRQEKIFFTKYFCELEREVWRRMRGGSRIGLTSLKPFPSIREWNELIKPPERQRLKFGHDFFRAYLSYLIGSQRYGFDYSVSNDLLHENGTLTREGQDPGLL